MANQNRATQGAAADVSNVDTSAAGLFSASGVFGSNFDGASKAWESTLAADDGDNQNDHDAASREAARKPRNQDDEATETEDDEDELDPEEDTEDAEDDEESEQEDDEEDETEDDEDNDTTTQELDPETKVKVKVDGEELEVTLDELRNGYSRTQDYTRKTMDLSETRKKLETQLGEELRGWQEAVGQVKTFLKAQTQSRSDAEWARLQQDDPYTYYQERDKQRQLNEQLQAVEQAEKEAQQEQQKLQQGEWERWKSDEQSKLKGALPEWFNDPKVAQAEQQEIVNYGRELGFSDQELMSLIDHRHILVLRDAAKYRKLQQTSKKPENAAKVKTRGKKPLKPGAKSTTANSSNVKRRKANQRLQKTGSVQDAAKVFESFLD